MLFQTIPSRALPAAAPDADTAGFTLIEVLVAFAIAALMLGTFLQLFGGGLRSSQSNDDHGVASLLAESTLAGIGVSQPIREGTSMGDFDRRFRWQVDQWRYAENRTEAGEPALFHITVTILWGDAENEHSLALETLRLGGND